MDSGYPKSKERSLREIEELKKLDRELEEGLLETFPASDAITVTQPVRNHPPVKKRDEW